MTRETIFWILLISCSLYKYDIFLLDYVDSMSDRYDFICLSLIIMYYSIIFYAVFVSRRKKDLNESIIWIIYMITISSSCRNTLNEMIDAFDFLFLSIILFFVIFTVRLIYSKKETNVPYKILIVFLFVLKILWPGILYTWPYRCDYPDNLDFSNCSDISNMNDFE